MSDEPVKRGPGRPRKKPLEEEANAPRVEEANDGSLIVEVEPSEEGMIPMLLLKNYFPQEDCTKHSLDGKTMPVARGEKVMKGSVLEVSAEEARRMMKNNLGERAGALE